MEPKVPQIPFPSERLAEVEKQYGTRLKLPVGHGEPLLNHHFRGELDNSLQFVYCPIGFIASWHPKDYENSYCAWCKIFFGEA